MSNHLISRCGLPSSISFCLVSCVHAFSSSHVSVAGASDRIPPRYVSHTGAVPFLWGPCHHPCVKCVLTMTTGIVRRRSNDRPSHDTDHPAIWPAYQSTDVSAEAPYLGSGGQYRAHADNIEPHAQSQMQCRYVSHRQDIFPPETRTNYQTSIFPPTCFL